MTDKADVTGSWGSDSNGPWSILVHGGAGDVKASAIDAHVEGCREAARAGAAILRAGGTAIDAVQRAVELLEDNPHFNAGTGACLTENGTLELDAAIMDGALRAGGVCALPPFEHPIAIARAVLESNSHVLYAGDGAAHFACAMGFQPASAEAMTTEAARARLEAWRTRPIDSAWAGGTVGAVARDAHGHVSAATSTGGMVGKIAGRIGDSPVFGAGTYADDEAGACSNTGSGEAVLRVCLAKSVIDLLKAGVSPREASERGMRLLLQRGNGTGGTILVDRHGNLGFARNTRTMTWAAATASWRSDLRAGS